MTIRIKEVNMALIETNRVNAFRRFWRYENFLAALLLGLISSIAVAEVKMLYMEFSSLPGDQIEIRMVFDGTPPSPTGYTIEQPARIALDLMQVKSGLDSKYHPLGGGNARDVTVVEAGDRTRVIVSLTELVAYSAYVEGNSLYVLVGQLRLHLHIYSFGQLVVLASKHKLGKASSLILD